MHPIKQFLRDDGMKPAELAELLNISVQHLYLIFTSQRWPSYELACKISEVTGIGVCELWTHNRHIN